MLDRFEYILIEHVHPRVNPSDFSNHASWFLIDTNNFIMAIVQLDQSILRRVQHSHNTYNPADSASFLHEHCYGMRRNYQVTIDGKESFASYRFICHAKRRGCTG